MGALMYFRGIRKIIYPKAKRVIDDVTQDLTHGRQPNPRRVAEQIGGQNLEHFYFMYVLFYDKFRRDGTRLTRHSYDPIIRPTYRKRKYKIDDDATKTILFHDIPEEKSEEHPYIIQAFVYNKIIEDIFGRSVGRNVDLLQNYNGIVIKDSKDEFLKNLNGSIPVVTKGEVIEQLEKIMLDLEVESNYVDIQKATMAHLYNRFKSFSEHALNKDMKLRLDFIFDYLTYFHRKVIDLDIGRIKKFSYETTDRLVKLTESIDLNCVEDINELTGNYTIFDELNLESYRKFYLERLFSDVKGRLERGLVVAPTKDIVNVEGPFIVPLVAKDHEMEDNVILMDDVNPTRQYNIKEKSLSFYDMSKDFIGYMLNKRVRNLMFEIALDHLKENLIKAMKKRQKMLENIDDTTFDLNRKYLATELVNLEKLLKSA